MLRVASDGPVLRVTLNRPDVRNAFNDELIGRLHATFAEIAPAGPVRAVVLAGEGPSFCAGGDLQWMKKAAAYTEEQNEEDALRLAKLFQTMVDCPAPIIARVHGPAFGGGCGLVACSDIAIASENALFAFSEVRLGLVPATISPFVIRKIGHGHARALFSTGEAFDSERALRIGLVNEAVAATELEGAIDKKLKAILSAGPSAIAASKKLAQEEPMGLKEAAKMLASFRSSDEGREGVGAFLEKRKASFVEPWGDSS